MIATNRKKFFKFTMATLNTVMLFKFFNTLANFQKYINKILAKILISLLLYI